MSLTQLSALTGGKPFKRPYVAEINARKKFLPSIYAQKKEDAYRDEMHKISLQDLSLRQDALDEQKKAQKKARKRTRMI